MALLLLHCILATTYPTTVDIPEYLQWEDVAADSLPLLHSLRVQAGPSDITHMRRTVRAADQLIAKHRDHPDQLAWVLKDLARSDDRLVSELGLLSLARLSSDPNVQREFSEIVAKAKFLGPRGGLVAASYMPLTVARRVVSGWATDNPSDDSYELLGIIGDENTLVALRAIKVDPNDDESRVSILKAVDAIERRLRMNPQRQAERQRELLLFWQSERESGAHFEDHFANYVADAEALADDHVNFSTEFLRAASCTDLDGTVHTLALMLLGTQHVAAGIPELLRASSSADDQMNTDAAIFALGSLGPEGLRVLEPMLLTFMLKGQNYNGILFRLSKSGDAQTVVALKRYFEDPRLSKDQRAELVQLSSEINDRLHEPLEPAEPSSN